jgi:GDP-L-fucose synthase
MTDTKEKRRVLVTGASGFLGNAICDLLETSEFELITTNSAEHNLMNLNDCLLITQNVDTIIHTAGLVLSRNEQQKRPAEVFTVNTKTTLNIAEAAKENSVRRIIFISSVTAYPDTVPTPLTENYLWNGPVSDASYAYGTAKRLNETIARSYHEQYGIETCVLFLPNLYGPNDKFTYTPPPLIPNTILQIQQAITHATPTIIGGSNGDVALDVLYVTDAAVAVLHTLRADSLPRTLNIGTGTTVTIKAIYATIAQTLGYQGTIEWNESIPPPPRIMDTTLAEATIHWHSTTEFSDGIRATILSYRANNI